MVGFAAGRFAPREAYSLRSPYGPPCGRYSASLRSYRGWLLCREALHHASMISHRGRDYWLVRQGMKKAPGARLPGLFRHRRWRGSVSAGSGGLEHVENLFHLHDHLLDELMVLGGLLRVGTAG